MKMSKRDASNQKKSPKDATLGMAVKPEEGGMEEKRGEEGEGKIVVVGIRMDSQSRELLTWALVKVAVPGDLVVALHVLSSSSSSGAVAAADPSSNTTAVLSLAKELEAMLSVYEGFCNLKQIDLKLKISKGSSIRKVLVREANAFAASKLILGVAKIGRTIGSSSSASIAKYCAKKLPSQCSVLALSNGKIVFQREAAENGKALKRSSRDSSKVADNMDNELYCLLPIIGRKGRNEEASDPFPPPKDELNGCSIATYVKDSALAEALPRNSSSICSTETDNPCLNVSKDEESLALVAVEKSPSIRFDSAVGKQLTEGRPGWPSLRRLALTNRKNSSFEKPNISSVQSVMRKPMKSDGNPVVTDLPPPVFTLGDAEGKLPEELQSLRDKYFSMCRFFNREELMQATSNFSPDRLIGKGGSSSVFKGCLPGGQALAVKILKSSENIQREFVSEIEILTTLQHKSIISLIGFFCDNNNLILVYDYMSRGSLEEILHGEKVIKHVLSWSERYKVAIGVAEALNYLHGGGSTEPVIHRDVKSSNILLSEDYEPQLSDFGLAQWASALTSQLTCKDVAGTFGYLAPEYFLYGKVNEKIDVYAFGVVLLELLSGRKPISTGPKGQESLVMWAKPILQGGEVKQLIDPCLRHEYNTNQVESMMLAASLCTRRLNQARPQISLVLKLLLGDDDVIKWARSEVNSKVPGGIYDEISIPEYDIHSHLSLALLDVENESLSVSSTNQTDDSPSANTFVEEYMQWRWSRSSSFD